MQRGWNAEGLLQPLWERYDGSPELPRREALAKAVGTSPTSLSSINSGDRNLGLKLGGRIAAELGVSVLELGAPVGALNGAGQTLVDRLEQVEAKHDELRAIVLEALGRLDRFLATAQESPTSERSPGRRRR